MYPRCNSAPHSRSKPAAPRTRFSNLPMVLELSRGLQRRKMEHSKWKTENPQERYNLGAILPNPAYQGSLTVRCLLPNSFIIMHFSWSWKKQSRRFSHHYLFIGLATAYINHRIPQRNSFLKTKKQQKKSNPEVRMLNTYCCSTGILLAR